MVPGGLQSQCLGQRVGSDFVMQCWWNWGTLQGAQHTDGSVKAGSASEHHIVICTVVCRLEFLAPHSGNEAAVSAHAFTHSLVSSRRQQLWALWTSCSPSLCCQPGMPRRHLGVSQ